MPENNPLMTDDFLTSWVKRSRSPEFASKSSRQMSTWEYGRVANGFCDAWHTQIHPREARKEVFRLLEWLNFRILSFKSMSVALSQNSSLYVLGYSPCKRRKAERRGLVRILRRKVRSRQWSALIAVATNVHRRALFGLVARVRVVEG